MNRLSKKFLIGIVGIILLSCAGTIAFHTVFLERYYLHEKRGGLSAVCDGLSKAISQGDDIGAAIAETEAASQVIVVRIEQFQEKDNDAVNDEIRSAFQEHGIGFQKYWLWEEDQNRILDEGSCRRLYEQERLDYSLLVEYRKIGETLYVVTRIVPNIADAFGIIHTFLLAVNAVSVAVSILMIVFLVRRIVRPLAEFQAFAERMEQNQFVPVQVHTKDELEEVADSLNSMGRRIVCDQASLEAKNRQMEQLLDNVAHDLKTPISLIQLYADGLKDGLDDGTFVDTIRTESRQMAEMADRLLYLSRIDKTEQEMVQIDLSERLARLIEAYAVLAESNHLTIFHELEPQILITASEEQITSLFTNLITNAIKYASGGTIQIELVKKNGQAVFSIWNETDNQTLDLARIWEPYYVGEPSRSRSLSGTGLGLSIVRKICERQGYPIECALHDGKLAFTVAIPC